MQYNFQLFINQMLEYLVLVHKTLIFPSGLEYAWSCPNPSIHFTLGHHY
jgi:hypothetical protein